MSGNVRVAVFIDWQNAYKSARAAFGWEAYPNEHGNFSPFQLARMLASRNQRGVRGVVSRVEIHRGLPSPSKDQRGHSACRRQSAAWMKENEEVVIPRLRPLWYPRDWPNTEEREKGVDVQLALGLLECAVFDQLCDVAVLFTNDSDLLPVVERVARLRGETAIETASWAGHPNAPRLRSKLRIVHHSLTLQDFGSVERRINYGHTP